MQSHPLSSNPVHEAQLPRTGHPTSQSFGFTSSTGMILPVFYDFLRVGESVHYEGSLFSRTQPMVTAAMADVDVYVDWFFVPAQMLLLNIGSMMWMTNDAISSQIAPSTTGKGILPLIDINSYMDNLIGATQAGYGASWYDVIGSAGEDSRFDCVGSSCFRLLNHLGLNPNGVFHPDASGSYNFQHDPYNPNIFPMFALAYQACYQDYYRIDSRERRDIYSFNLDALESAGGVATAGPQGLFKLRYRAYHQDYFTGVQPTPLMDSVNMLGGTASSSYPSPSEILQKIDNYLGLGNGSYFSSNPNLGNSLQDSNTSGLINSSNSPAFAGVNNPDAVNVRYGKMLLSGGTSPLPNTNISTANIRSMFAVEKLLRITGRARKDYDSQVLAHLGYQVPHDVKHEISHLGCDKAMLHIGEVVSTADTYSGVSGAALGSISGKGYVNIRGKKRKFTAPCDGVFMALYSAVPRVRYFGTYDKLNNFVDRLSFYQPEYDKLGAQPLYSFEAEAGVAGQSATRIGWQYRYEQYKRKYDRVTEAFASNVYGGSGQVNQYSAWVLGRLPYKQNGSIVNLTFDDFLCPPTALDNIMVMPYSTQWSASYIQAPWLIFARDPFINDFHCHCTKVSTMSRFGEPPLD